MMPKDKNEEPREREDVTEEYSFDELTRGLANGHLSRGGAIKLVSAAILGGTLSSFVLPDDAEAKKKKKCPAGTVGVKRGKRVRCVPSSSSPREPNASCLVQGTQASSPQTNGRYAQTFTEPNGGWLNTAQLVLGKATGSSGDFLLQINTVDPNTGFPTNNTIASTVLPSANVGTNIALVTFSFTYPARVEAGKQYALVLSRPGVSPNFWVDVQNPGTCAGGQEFYSPSQTESFNAFGADLPYATFVSP